MVEKCHSVSEMNLETKISRNIALTLTLTLTLTLSLTLTLIIIVTLTLTVKTVVEIFSF